jgi:hypothetical protein
MTGVEFKRALRRRWAVVQMREPDFTAIVRQLEKSGISSGHANRTANELRDHYDDLVDAAVDSGADSRKARQLATRQLGDMNDFVAEMAARRELKTWAFRYPRLAVVFYPLACVGQRRPCYW